SPGEEAGLKSATFAVKGENAYGILKAERGVHQLVRLSPFDQAHRRHTSFAQVIVSPLLPEDVDVENDESDLRIDIYRASGAGGFHPRVSARKGRGKGSLATPFGRLGRLALPAPCSGASVMAVQEPDIQHTDETSSTTVLDQEPVAPPPAPASSPMVVFENVT